MPLATLRAALQPFRPRALTALKGVSREQLVADIGAGLTVGIVALPLAMAFAIASGVKPEAGLFTAIIAGFLISALGGSNVQIGGPAGAFIVIVYGIVDRYGLANLLIATSLAGVLLFAMGLFKLGALVRFIPVSIVIGFTNGIAVLIGLSQFKDALGLPIAKMPGDFFAQLHTLGQHLGQTNPWALALTGGCLALVVVWPKSYTMPVGVRLGWHHRLRRVAAHLPGTVVALVGATLIARGLHLPVETIGSRFGGIPQGLPGFELPALSWDSAKQLFIPTVTIALLGSIESLLCARVADNTADIPRHDPNQELMAQGVANFVGPFFGGIPATGTIARTVTNVRAGGRTPLAGMIHALTLLLIVLVAAPLAAGIPLAAMAGILLFVAWNMGEWREFTRLRNFRWPYRLLLVGTFVLTVVFDLTVAVEVGLVSACAFFIVRMGSLFQVRPSTPPQTPAGVQVMELYGALFFGAVDKLEDLPARLPADTQRVVLDLHRLVAMDTSGLEALHQLRHALQRRGITMDLARAAEAPLSLLERSGFAEELGPQHLWPTLEAALAPARP
ncbi:SulP family inorganic anion transporter [Ideonella dechloratans]|uniref:SulP family inorganic anion transporter n=1 Tax=Ideonella dechloratans TaxID=36863 RepID=UPI0035B19ED3